MAKYKNIKELAQENLKVGFLWLTMIVRIYDGLITISTQTQTRNLWTKKATRERRVVGQSCKR